MEVVADSDLFYRSSTIPLEGDGAAANDRPLRVSPRPSEVTASLIGADLSEPWARTHVDVIESRR